MQAFLVDDLPTALSIKSYAANISISWSSTKEEFALSGCNQVLTTVDQTSISLNLSNTSCNVNISFCQELRKFSIGM